MKQPRQWMIHFQPAGGGGVFCFFLCSLGQLPVVPKDWLSMPPLSKVGSTELGGMSSMDRNKGYQLVLACLLRRKRAVRVIILK
jgi:hypothetical protein